MNGVGETAYRFARRDDGGVTVEAAISLAAIVSVLVLCIGAMVCVLDQLRCQDAAREAARLAARGDDARAVEVAARVAPPGARIEVRTEGDLVVVTVRSDASVPLPLTLTAEAVAVNEPDVVL